MINRSDAEVSDSLISVAAIKWSMSEPNGRMADHSEAGEAAFDEEGGTSELIDGNSITADNT